MEGSEADLKGCYMKAYLGTSLTLQLQSIVSFKSGDWSSPGAKEGHG